MKYIFIDGSSIVRNNKKYGGSGVYFKKKKQVYQQSISTINTTSQQAELMGLYLGINLCNELIKNNVIKKYPTFISDSQYVIQIFSDWLEKWLKNKTFEELKKSKKNIDIIKLIYDSIDKKQQLKFQHINSHQKQPKNSKDSLEYLLWYGNDQADKLACNASKISSLLKIE